MAKTKIYYQQGIAHVILVIVGVVALLGAIGCVAYTQITGAQANQAKVKNEEEAARKAQDALAMQQQAIATEQPAAAASPPVAPGCNRNETRYVTAGVGLSVRPEKSTTSQALTVAPYGSAMLVGCLEGEWLSAEYNGKVGYVLAAYVSTAKPAAQPSPQTAAAHHPVQANCLPNDGAFTVYASVGTGTPTYWDYSFTKPSGIIIPYRTAITVHCFNNSIQRLVYASSDSFVKASDVTTTKP